MILHKGAYHLCGDTMIRNLFSPGKNFIYAVIACAQSYSQLDIVYVTLLMYNNSRF